MHFRVIGNNFKYIIKLLCIQSSNAPATCPNVQIGWPSVWLPFSSALRLASSPPPPSRNPSTRRNHAALAAAARATAAGHLPIAEETTEAAATLAAVKHHRSLGLQRQAPDPPRAPPSPRCRVRTAAATMCPTHPLRTSLHAAISAVRAARAPLLRGTSTARAERRRGRATSKQAAPPPRPTVRRRRDEQLDHQVLLHPRPRRRRPRHQVLLRPHLMEQ